MLILSSALLAGFPHGFTTRAGGASRSPYAGLNLSTSTGDEGASVEENWARLRQETGLSFARVKQVHGSAVARRDAPSLPGEEADAVITARPGLAACVLTADCVPILLGDPSSGAVAAVHAGWRGTLARAAARAVEALEREFGARRENLLAAVGPAIGPCCYEVSPDLAERFVAEIGPSACMVHPRTPRVDLWTANERVLCDAGIPPERIEVIERCTACDDEAFFSHRRDGVRTGRQVGFIAPPRAPFLD
ncbi:MAG: peptidoglycan editing factor PgeF [Deltaproteobacteria bacterium]|nr:peptidoglycan editing factor PgeF [Deltaproteobacteria bacterium]